MYVCNLWHSYVQCVVVLAVSKKSFKDLISCPCENEYVVYKLHWFNHAQTKVTLLALITMPARLERSLGMRLLYLLYNDTHTSHRM